MYVQLKEKNIVFSKLILSWTSAYITDWETTHLGHMWNWGENWRSSQVQTSFVLNFTTLRCAFLFFVSKILDIPCYLTWMK